MYNYFSTDSELKHIISVNISKIINKANVNYTILAVNLDIPLSTLNEYTQEKRIPPISFFIRLKSYYKELFNNNLDIDEFLTCNFDP